MDKEYVISLLEKKGYRQKNIVEEHLIPMWHMSKKVFVILVTEELKEEDMYFLLNTVKKETNEFYIVGETETILYSQAKRDFFKWVNEELGGIDKVKGQLKANFSTIDKVESSKQIWDHLSF